MGGRNKEGWIHSLIKIHVEINLLDHIFQIWLGSLLEYLENCFLPPNMTLSNVQQCLKICSYGFVSLITIYFIFKCNFNSLSHLYFLCHSKIDVKICYKSLFYLISSDQWEKRTMLSQIYFYILKVISLIEEVPNLEMSHTEKLRGRPEF